MTKTDTPRIDWRRVSTVPSFSVSFLTFRYFTSEHHRVHQPPVFVRREQCYCGVDADDPARLGDATCNFDCAGDASQTCGGRNAISVYEYNTDVTPPESLGCWADTKSDRIMDVVQSSSSMTNDVSSFPPGEPPRRQYHANAHVFYGRLGLFSILMWHCVSVSRGRASRPRVQYLLSVRIRFGRNSSIRWVAAVFFIW